MKRRRRRIPGTPPRARPLPAPRRFSRVIRRLRECFLGVIPGATDITPANDPEK
jgi:hypothetical protein